MDDIGISTNPEECRLGLKVRAGFIHSRLYIGGEWLSLSTSCATGYEPRPGLEVLSTAARPVMTKNRAFPGKNSII